MYSFELSLCFRKISHKFLYHQIRFSSLHQIRMTSFVETMEIQSLHLPIIFLAQVWPQKFKILPLQHFPTSSETIFLYIVKLRFHSYFLLKKFKIIENQNATIWEKQIIFTCQIVVSMPQIIFGKLGFWVICNISIKTNIISYSRKNNIIKSYTEAFYNDAVFVDWQDFCSG